MKFIILLSVLFSLNGFAQERLATDGLTSKFHKARRAALRAKLPPNSVAVFFSNPVRNRSNDVNHKYHQDPDFYYLTGLKEPHSLLLVFSNDYSIKEKLYVQEKNEVAERWNGIRYGLQKAKEQLGVAVVSKTNEFKNDTINFKGFDTVYLHRFKNDVRDLSGNNNDLYALINQLKSKINYNEVQPTEITLKIYEVIKTAPLNEAKEVSSYIKKVADYYPEVLEDKYVFNYVNDESRQVTKTFITNYLANKPNYSLDKLNVIMGDLRETKTPEELILLTKAIKISAQGQREIMKAMKPNMSEAEIQGIHEFVYKKYGSEDEGYQSIVGAGHNGCVLHYVENTKMNVSGDLVLMDLGAEYHGYTADVTRTIPANGKFTKEQAAIYNIVLEAQEAAIKASTVGKGFFASNKIALDIINKELVRLGIIANENTNHNYLPHGISHYLGLDVHDLGSYGPLKANTVITIEPGIYIPKNSPCNKKWWGIAIRIEDDILITKNGPINLSESAPRSIKDVEKLMKQSSPLDQFYLPKLD